MFWIKELKAVEGAGWYNLSGGLPKEDKKERSKPTTKKIKVGDVRYKIDAETGEIDPCMVIDVKEMDYNFKKFFVSQWLSTAEILGKRSKLVFWIMDKIDHSNRLVYTQEKIAQETELSLKTVQVTLALLQKHGFLIKEQNGVYRINPRFIFKGSHQQRMNIWIQYSQLEKDENPN